MLHPFLFIGVGGSGGKTLRTLKSDLTQRLAEVQYEGPWPSCWQFLHIDVPTTADGNEPDLPAQLEEKDYVGLVGKSLDYRVIDDTLVQSGRADEAVLRNLLGWRPEAVRVHVPVTRGAGQFRALGRSIALTNLGTIGEALRKAKSALHGPQMSADLSAVSRAFGVAVADTPPGPEVVVVSSLAGGSGSGAFLDVCDALRAVGDGGWTDESFALLYAPDVFSNLEPDSRKGVYANALAALCELMSGFWDPEPRSADFAVMQGRGIAVGAPQRRGPRFPLIVGTRNDKIGFTNQNEVYRAMGKAMAAWVVSEHLQNDIKAYATGNWGQSALLPDATRLRSGEQEQPLCAIGFARVSLGRDNFAEYASERLARRAVDRALRQHLADRPPEADPNHDVAIEEVVNARFGAFLSDSGLDERGEERNQIIDALRPLDRDSRLATACDVVRSNLVAGRSKPVAARQLLAECIALLQEQQQRFSDEEVARRNDRAREWFKAIQTRLVHLTAISVAQYGAPVTDKLLARLRAELEYIVTELPDEEAKLRHWTEQLEQLVSGAMVPTSDLYPMDHPAISQAIQKGVECFDWMAEADLRQFAVTMVNDLLHNLVEPLHNAVRSGKELLAVREAGTSNEPSIVDRWPVADLMPRRFQPAGNEFLLEPVDSYPTLYREAITSSSSADDAGGAEAEFVRHTIVGSRPTDREAQSLIHTHTSWVPAVAEIQGAFGSSARAQFELRIEPRHLLERARSLVEDRDAPIGVLVGESLQDHLDERRVDPARLARRIERFHDGLIQALQTSAPLVNIDPKVLQRVHGTSQPGISYMFTEIPFPEGTPGYETVKKVLESRGQWGDDVRSAFSEGRQARIDVFSMLASAYNPVVFESIVGPVADEWAKRQSDADQRDGFWRWRRARPLPTFLPLSPEVRLAMIRGWFTARLLGELVFDPSDREVMKIWDPHLEKTVAFPHPLLGPAVFEEWERLPAVLESLPLALVEFAERATEGDIALAPYWRLRALGTDARGAEKDYRIANRSVEDWIRNGRTSLGAPPANPALAGPAGDSADAADERKDRCTLTLQNWQKRYGDLIDAPVTLKGFYDTPRVAELGGELVSAINDIERAIERVKTTESANDY